MSPIDPGFCKLAQGIGIKLREGVEVDRLHEMLNTLMCGLSEQLRLSHRVAMPVGDLPGNRDGMTQVAMLEHLSEICFVLMFDPPTAAKRLNQFIEEHFEAPLTDS